MTIKTKSNREKKPPTENSCEKSLIINDASWPENPNIDPDGRPNLSQAEMEMWLSPSIRRRISTTTTVCIFITALLVMSICIIGGVYFYRQRMSRFRGWCGIPFRQNELNFKFGNKDHQLGPNKPFFKENRNAEWLTSHHRFRQDFDIDLDTELHERIDVPDFGYGRQGRFLHDFHLNKTAIIDMKSKRCFVFPLDRVHVKPPRFMFDLISKMWMGYYDVDTKAVRYTFRVVRPRMQDFSSLGIYIEHNCEQFPTYLLALSSDRNARIRRDADVANVSTAVEDDDLVDAKSFTVAEFAGQNILEYTIVDG